MPFCLINNPTHIDTPYHYTFPAKLSTQIIFAELKAEIDKIGKKGDVHWFIELCLLI
jgi:hypothetical protein